MYCIFQIQQCYKLSPLFKRSKLHSQWIPKTKRVYFVFTPYTRVWTLKVDKLSLCLWIVPNAVPTLLQWNNHSKRQWTWAWEHCHWQDQIEVAETEEVRSIAAYVSNMATNCETAQDTLPVMKDHNFVASSSLDVDRIKNKNMVREVEKLREQVNPFYLTHRFSLERFFIAREYSLLHYVRNTEKLN